MPWELSVKIGAVLGLGIVDLAASLVILWQLFSEEKWIRFSGAERFIDETLNGN